MTDFIITMRRELARRYAKDRSILNVKTLLAPVKSARIVGAPNYSMRISVDEADAPQLERLLAADYIVEADYVMHLLRPGHAAARPTRGAKPPRAPTSAARTQPR